MSVYVATVDNAARQTSALLAAAAPSDIVGIVKLPTAYASLPTVVLKAAIDYELAALKTALYTQYNLTP